MLTKKQLATELRRMGINEGDMLYLHCSFKKIGMVEDGPAGLIETILAVLGPKGTLAMPAHSMNYPGCVEEAYDKMNSPGVQNGIVSETLRKWPGTLRSAHPSHSTIALGHNAEFLTATHCLRDPFDADSPLFRFYSNGGKVLLLGVGHDRNTCIHLADAILKTPYNHIPYNENWANYALTLDENGNPKKVYQDNFPGHSGAFNRLEGMLYYEGLVHYGSVGEAVAMLMDAKPVVDFTVKVLREKPDFLLCYDPACPSCPRRRKYLETHCSSESSKGTNK